MNYGDNTYRFFSALTHRNLQIISRAGQLDLKIPDEDFTFHPARCGQVTEELLEAVRNPHEKKKELAQRIAMDKSVLSAVVSDKSTRSLTRDAVLWVLLYLDRVPTVDQVNHKLMELMKPGLFTETWDIRENRRNWVLYQIIEYAQDHPCPVDGWQYYANSALSWLKLPPLNAKVPPVALPSEDLRRLEHWRGEIAGIHYVDFTVRRRQLLEDYQLRQGLDYHGGQTAAMERLARETGISQAMVESVFGTLNNRNSNVSPQTLIPVLAAMGCTLLEANEMLLQANRPLIYHTACSEYDLQWIRRLMENEAGRRN